MPGIVTAPTFPYFDILDALPETDMVTTDLISRLNVMDSITHLAILYITLSDCIYISKLVIVPVLYSLASVSTIGAVVIFNTGAVKLKLAGLALLTTAYSCREVRLCRVFVGSFARQVSEKH